MTRPRPTGIYHFRPPAQPAGRHGPGPRLGRVRRNAARALADFTADQDALDTHIAWAVTSMRDWNDHGPDGGDLRMAEFLVHRQVPWQAVHRVVVKIESARDAVAEMIRALDHIPPVDVVADWYF